MWMYIHVYFCVWRQGRQRKLKMRKANATDRQDLINISTGMSGKMDGVLSLSTPCLDNPRCQTYIKCSDFVCNKCFANATLHARDNVYQSLSKNKILWERNLSFEEAYSIAWEIVATCEKQYIDYDVKMFRLESFGDIANPIHARNYIYICSLVQHLDSSIDIAWWTKNPNYIETAVKEISTIENGENVLAAWRENTNVVLSSHFMDVPYPQKARKHYEEVFGMEVLTFTVHRVPETSPIVNCGARSCRACRRCYKKENRGTDVIEALK